MKKTEYYNDIIGLHSSSGDFLQIDRVMLVGDREAVVTKDLHCVFGYELRLQQHDILKISEIVTMQNNLNHLLRLKHGSIIQFHFDLTQKKLYMLIKKPILPNTNPLSSILFTVGKINESFETDLIKNIERCIKDLSEVDASKAISKRLSSEDIINLTKIYLKQDNTQEQSSKNDISKSIIDTSINVDNTKIEVGENEIVSYSIKDFFEGEENENDLNYGQVSHLIDSLIEKKVDGFIVYNCVVINKDKTLNYINSLKSFFLDKIASRLIKNSLKYKHYIELLVTRADIHNDARYLDCTFHLVTSNKNEPQELKNIFMEAIGAKLTREDFLNLGIFELCIPCQFHPISNFFTKRDFTLRENQLALLIPIFGEFSGHDEGIEFLNRYNQLITINTKSEKAGHIAVLSSSGSGKSTLINKILSHYNEHEGATVIKLDFNTTSREKAKKSSNYEIIEISENNAPNCFSGVFDKEKIEFVKMILIDSIKLCDLTFKNKLEHGEIIEESLKKLVLIKNGTSKGKRIDIYLEELILEIEQYANSKESEAYEKFGIELINKLILFHGNGIKADLFRGQTSKATKNKNFIIYDFYNIDKDSVFLPIVTALIIHDIKVRIKELKKINPSTWGFIVFEELNYLSKNLIISEYFDYLVEVIRKENFQIITCAPSWETFTNTKIGRKAFNMSSQKIIGEITGTEISNFIKSIKTSPLSDQEVNKEIENDSFNEAMIQTIKSLKTNMNLYADFLFIDEFDIKRSGVFRYVPTRQDFVDNMSGNKNYLKYLDDVSKQNQSQESIFLQESLQ